MQDLSDSKELLERLVNRVSKDLKAPLEVMDVLENLEMLVPREKL
jgi:hypothetical protein